MQIGRQKEQSTGEGKNLNSWDEQGKLARFGVPSAAHTSPCSHKPLFLCLSPCLYTTPTRRHPYTCSGITVALDPWMPTQPSRRVHHPLLPIPSNSTHPTGQLVPRGWAPGNPECPPSSSGQQRQEHPALADLHLLGSEDLPWVCTGREPLLSWPCQGRRRWLC